MNTMPSNIDYLSSGKFFISNLDGFQSLVDKYELNLLTNNEFPIKQVTSLILESKLLTEIYFNQFLQETSIISNLNIYFWIKIPIYEFVKDKLCN